jgi:hypothetical protein
LSIEDLSIGETGLSIAWAKLLFRNERLTKTGWHVMDYIMSKPQIPYKLIPLAKVPSHEPVAKPVTYARGSQWDRVLAALEQKGGEYAAKITAANRRQRKDYESTLQTIAKNRNQFVEVRDDDKDETVMYAWMSLAENVGRFSSPVDADA